MKYRAVKYMGCIMPSNMRVLRCMFMTLLINADHLPEYPDPYNEGCSFGC